MTSNENQTTSVFMNYEPEIDWLAEVPDHPDEHIDDIFSDTSSIIQPEESPSEEDIESLFSTTSEASSKWSTVSESDEWNNLIELNKSIFEDIETMWNTFIKIETEMNPKKETYFSKKYKTDEEYRKKHLEYVKKKVPCDICLIDVPRANMAKHKRTEKHKHNEDIINKAQEKQDLKDSKLKLEKIQYLNYLKNKFRNCVPLHKYPVQKNFLKEIDDELAELLAQ